MALQILPRQASNLVLSFVLNMSRSTSELYFMAQERNWEGFKIRAEALASDAEWKDGNVWIVLHEVRKIESNPPIIALKWHTIIGKGYHSLCSCCILHSLRQIFIQACKYNPPAEAIAPLVESRVNIGAMPDITGRTPLHIACRHGASIDVIALLVKNAEISVSLEAPFIANGFRGALPLDYLFYFYSKMPKETTMQFNRALTNVINSDHLDHFSLNYFWRKASLLLIVMRYGIDGLGATVNFSHKSPVIIFLTYDAALACGCPDELLQMIIILREKLLNGANQLDGDKRLLINVLLEGHLKWNDGLKEVTLATPSLGLITRDNRTHLLPFMLAAANKSDTRTIYELLKMNPDAVACGLWGNKGPTSPTNPS